MTGIARRRVGTFEERVHCLSASLLLMLMAGTAWPASANVKAPPTAPKSPAAERAGFRLADPQLEIELVASEPQVVSPVAMAWDAQGRLFVAEMSDYPRGPGTGRIKCLSEPDADGKFRRVTVFAQGLPFPNGVLPWNGGILVTAAPNIWFLRDVDGDGQADEKRIVLTGFGEGNQQLRVNGLHWGLDNWIYGANGRSDGNIRRPHDPVNKAVSIRRRDFRFRPDTGQFEAIAGFSQFGLGRDDWNNRFPSWNTIPIRHVVLEDRYLERNPLLAAAPGIVPLTLPHDLQVFPVSPRPETFNREPVTHFNASCGLTIFRGDLLGDPYTGNAFVCEPLTNLVQRRQLRADGVSFTAQRGEERQEFLAGSDPWFHPVNLSTGPDGALYIVDFYRQWVEHPDFVPPNVRGRVDWRIGAEHGRIWRVRRRGAQAGPAPDLAKASSKALVRLLAYPNGWTRDTAQRLLVERSDVSVAEDLRALLRKDQPSLASAHALWVLKAVTCLTADDIRKCLGDPNARVVEQAILAAEDGPNVVEEIMKLSGHADPRVRLRVALAAGGLTGSKGFPALAQIAWRDSHDEWIRLAIRSALTNRAAEFLEFLVTSYSAIKSQPTPGQAKLLAEIAALVGASGRDQDIALTLGHADSAEKAQAIAGGLALLAGLAEGLGRTDRSLTNLVTRPPEKLASSLGCIPRLVASARQTSLANGASVDERLLAIKVMALESSTGHEQLWLDLLGPSMPSAIQTAAARQVSMCATPALAERVLEQWSRLMTGTRSELLATFLRMPSLTPVLVKALEDGTLRLSELNTSVREGLRRVSDADLRRRVVRLLDRDIAEDRQSVVRKFAPALALAGDAGRGGKVFSRHCLTCHQIQGTGRRVGPDLSGVGGRARELLLADILDPSREVSGDFLNFVLVTKRGQVINGLLAAESAASVTLRRAEGIEETVLRSEIEELQTNRKSLMPEGFENSLTAQDLADLLSFLQSPTKLPAENQR